MAVLPLIDKRLRETERGQLKILADILRERPVAFFAISIETGAGFNEQGRTERIRVLRGRTVTWDQDIAAVRIDDALEKIREAPGRNGVTRVPQRNTAVLADIVIALQSGAIPVDRTLGDLVQILRVRKRQ